MEDYFGVGLPTIYKYYKEKEEKIDRLTTYNEDEKYIIFTSPCFLDFSQIDYIGIENTLFNMNNDNKKYIIKFYKVKFLDYYYNNEDTIKIGSFVYKFKKGEKYVGKNN